ncbi:MAG: hypothetical protein HQL60_06175 [Magnetococcales bacterium]|nr:hypothetical protein [Magnetococcales bacterium]
MRGTELQKIGERLYGNGLMASVYIRALAEDMDQPVSHVKKWWYGVGDGLSVQARSTLEQVLARRGHDKHSYALWLKYRS